ncbi:MAG: hypothetical protein K5905_15230 [Roseibium sp.]|uniref:hypothetical protein n=1 Tax=Roseibium sp. TaxID=1936156 RepID=UPI002606B603|nr:hypothetical protein [Roseibium sp.]MCV0426812.1 hypothetical protein [Roseibium sp.]
MLESFSEEKSITPCLCRLKIIVLGTILLLSTAIAALSQSVYEPARGTTERKAILNAVRPLVEARVGPPVEFVVGWMRAGNGWAFVQLDPQRPGGGVIDPGQTVYASQMDYMDGLATYALLRYQYDRWNLIDFVVGPTDVFWSGDPLYSQVPPGLTPY